MDNKDVYTFTARVNRKVYSDGDFRIYAMDVDSKKFPEIHKNKYDNVSIMGDLFDLERDVDYEISAEESETKYGISYRVISCIRDVPASYQDMYHFLSEILTANQAKTLYENYPDIVDRVRTNRLGDIDFEKLHGIGEKSFEKIKSKILDNYRLADMMLAFDGYLTIGVIRKLNDEYGSVERIRSTLAREPYRALCKIDGVGFKRADEILLNIEQVSRDRIAHGKQPIINFGFDLRTSEDRCRACVMYILGQNELDGHTKINLADLHSICAKLVPECEHHFAAAMDNPIIYYNKEKMIAAFDSTYHNEEYIAKTLINALKENISLWDYDIEKYRSIGNVLLSDEQMRVLKNLCQYNISILNGPGGTGKSFSTKAVIRMLEEHGHSFMLMSPTGKAAKVLSAYAGVKASTIHRALGYIPGGMEKIEQLPSGLFVSYKTNWDYDDNNKLDTDVVIVDEFSMVDVKLFAQLLHAIDFKKTRLLMIGDNAQLPSVSCGNLLHDFLAVDLIPSATLTNVFRYADGGLMKIATDVRCCKPYLLNGMRGKRTVFGDNQDYTFIDIDQEKIPDLVVKMYKTLLSAGNSMNSVQVLAAQKKGDCGVDALNNKIQSVANPLFGSDNYMEVGSTRYYVGDPVIQMENNYNAKICTPELDPLLIESLGFSEKEKHVPTAFVANGETGIIKEITPGQALIDFDGIVVTYNKEEMHRVGLGYAMTIHKSQGSSIDHVILVTPKAHTFMMNSNLLYVGLTRMKKRCFHIGTLLTVNKAISKKANLTRHTFMQEMLISLSSENSTNIIEETPQTRVCEDTDIQDDINQIIEEFHDNYEKIKKVAQESEYLNEPDWFEDMPWFTDAELKNNKNFFGN